MQISEIKKELMSGQQFGNESANWYTLSKPSESRHIIVLNGDYKFYKSLDSFARRISSLIKTGN
jgi:hypothetical protein